MPDHEKSALIILAKGAEEIETITVADVLARANVHVTLGGLESADVVECSRGFGIKANVLLDDVSTTIYDAIIMPGGLKGAKSMADSKVVKAMLHAHYNAGKIVAAICAAPIGLQKHGVALGKKITSYPAMKKDVPDFKYSEDKVVVDGNLITSRGPGTAMLFALTLVEALFNKEKAKTTAEAMLVDYY